MRTNEFVHIQLEYATSSLQLPSIPPAFGHRERAMLSFSVWSYVAKCYSGVDTKESCA